jgi:two-component system sensor histidine kinase/response regulator
MDSSPLAPQLPQATGRTSLPRVLAVDDQESNLRALGAILGRMGLETVPVTNGEEALRQLELRPPDLVMLDLFMPGMDGIELCRRIRERVEWADLPIVFLSADDDKKSIVRAFDAGGVDYVTKPFNPAELTSRVRTQLALKAARDDLRRLAEDKDELLGILAHDLKNHLGGMQMSVRLLHDRTSALGEDRLRRTAENILQATNHMLAFVKEFLANASTERGLVLNLESVSLTAAAQAAARQYQEAAAEKGITLIDELSEPPVWITADRAALRQVIENLVSNAIKFSPSGRRVWVSVAPFAGGGGECCVRDEGPGFSEADRRGLFLRYRRLTARPTAGEPSTGLGLSIARKLAERMHGSLDCDPAEGPGATLVLRMPAAMGTDASTA